MTNEKLEMLSSMVATALNDIVEQMAKPVSVESIDEWSKTATAEDLRMILQNITDRHCKIMEDYVQDWVDDLIENSGEYIKKDDIDLDVINELGLSEEVAKDYVSCLPDYDKKDFIKDMIDEL